MKTEKLLSKPLCITVLVLAFIYGIALPFFWGNDPTSSTGTLSLLCEDKKPFFWAWSTLSSLGVILNIQYLYKKYRYKNNFLNVLCVISFISACLIALTLGHPIDSWNPKRIVHWIATGLFVVFIFAPVELFFILNVNKFKHFKILTVCVLSILLTFLGIFIFVGKSGLMEMIPLAMLEIFLFAVNFVMGPAKTTDKEETKDKVLKK